MSTVDFVIDEALEEIDGFRQRFSDLTPLMDLLVDDAEEWLTSGILSEGRTIGQSWASLTGGTAAVKARYGRPQPGVWDGVLLASLANRNAPYAHRVVRDDLGERGTTAPHAEIFAGGRKNQRRRPIMPTVAAMEQRYLPMITDYFTPDAGGFDGMV